MLDGSGSATHAGDSPVMRENRAAGSRAWSGGRAGTKGATDELVQIQGYASKTSVSCGESIDFHLSSHVAQERTVAIYRIGHYGGSGARHLVTSDGVHVRPRTKPSAAAVRHLPRHPPPHHLLVENKQDVVVVQVLDIDLAAFLYFRRVEGRNGVTAFHAPGHTVLIPREPIFYVDAPTIIRADVTNVLHQGTNIAPV
ncbi:hypothetical protein [Streptomyces sp. NPDC088249]